MGEGVVRARVETAIGAFPWLENGKMGKWDDAYEGYVDGQEQPVKM